MAPDPFVRVCSSLLYTCLLLSYCAFSSFTTSRLEFAAAQDGQRLDGRRRLADCFSHNSESCICCLSVCSSCNRGADDYVPNKLSGSAGRTGLNAVYVHFLCVHVLWKFVSRLHPVKCTYLAFSGWINKDSNGCRPRKRRQYGAYHPDHC